MSVVREGHLELIVPRAGAPHGRHSLGVPGFARQAALMNDFGRCTAMAEAETTDHAAMASLMARAEQLLTALAHLGPPLPHLPVLSRVAPNGPPRRQFSSANSANSVQQCFPDLQQAAFECTWAGQVVAQAWKGRRWQNL